MDPFIVDKARKNLEIAIRSSRAADLPDPGWRWQAYRSTTLKWVNFLRTPVEVIHAIQSPRSNMGYEARMTGRQLVEYARAMEQNCLRIFPEFADALGSFIESPLSYPGTLAIMNGRLVSSPLYNHIIQILRCAQFVRPGIVLEIGGGYGAPGRLWLTNRLHRPQIYIDVDFPESLYFSEIYLRANDQSLGVEYAHSAGDIERAISSQDGLGKVVLVPIALIQALKNVPIDLLINTGSFQEMTAEYVEYYMQWLDASKVDFFYSANYFGQKIDQLLEGMNYGAPVLGEHWRTLVRVLHQDALRPVAELMFQRSAEQPSSRSSIERSHTLLRAADPMPLPAFLELFDLSRNIFDAALLSNLVGRSLKMERIPKEALPLAIRALALAKAAVPEDGSLISTAEQLVDTLAAMAARGRSQMGIVDGTVTKLRGKLIDAAGKGEEFEVERGRLIETAEGTTIEIAGKVRSLRSGTYGAIERNEINANNLLISGWALGQPPSDRVAGIHVFLDGRLVDTAVPEILRPEFKLGDTPIGFQLESVLPIESALGMHRLVVAEFEDGTLGRLANGGDIAALASPPTPA